MKHVIYSTIYSCPGTSLTHQPFHGPEVTRTALSTNVLAQTAANSCSLQERQRFVESFGKFSDNDLTVSSTSSAPPKDEDGGKVSL